MDRPRLRLVAALLAIATVAACSGTSTSQLPVAPSATPAPSSTPVATTTTVTVASAAAQTLPTIGGGSASVSLAATAGTPANASIAVTVSSTPPGGAMAIAAAARKTLALSRIALAYYTFVSSIDIQLTSFPSFTVSFPTSLVPVGTTIKEAFLDAGTSQPVFTYDIAIGTSGATFTSSANPPKLLAGKTYIIAFYYEIGNTATATPIATPTPTASPSTVPTTGATATPVPVPTAIGFASGSATFTAVAGYNGLAGSIAPLVTVENGIAKTGTYPGNATFESTTQGAPSFSAATSANPLRQIILEVNDNTSISNSTTYATVGSTNNTAVLLYYAEYYSIGGTIMSRNWVASGFTVTFENVGNGAATYRIRGATFIPDTSYTSNPAVGTFTLNAVGTANPYTSN